MKTCGKCKIEKPLDQFARHSNRYDGVNAWCKPCFRFDHIKRTYNLDKGAYLSLVHSQDGKCGICKGTPPILCVDHDHACCPGKKSCGECVRGLLCQRCNRALGVLNDDRSLLAAMMQYLDSNEM